MHFLFSGRKAKGKKNPEILTSKDKVSGKNAGNSGMHDFIEVTGWKAQKFSISWKKKFELGSLKIKYHGHVNLK